MVREYYVVYTLVREDKSYYPMVVTCALIKDKYYRINDLDAYFKKEGGITDEEVLPDTAITINNHNWKSNLGLLSR